MSDRPQVLVSVTLMRPEEHLLLDALRATGVTAGSVTPRHTAACLNGDVAPPHLVLMRNVSHSELAAVTQRFERAGIPTINTPDAVRLCLSKDLQALAFRRLGVKHPVSRLAFTPEQVREQVAALGGDAVLKPVSGSWGRGIVRITDDQQITAWAGGREAVDPSGKAFPIVVQQHIPKRGYNERLIIVGDRPVAAYQQISGGDFRTNTHLGGRVEPIAIADRSRELADAVVACFGPGFYGVDLVESAETGELYVLEVNTNPDFANSSKVHGVDIAGEVARYARSIVDGEVALAATGGPR